MVDAEILGTNDYSTRTSTTAAGVAADDIVQANHAFANILEESAKFSTERKEKHALNHLNYFLRKNPGTAGKTAETLAYTELQHELFGQYATYLATDARHGALDSGPLLSLNTATGYFSATKMYFVKKFVNQNLPPVFEKVSREDMLHVCIIYT